MSKTPITSADLLNDQVLPFYEEHELPVLRIMTDRGTEFWGRPDKHDYQLFLAINDIDHNKTKVKHPQTNGICERREVEPLSFQCSIWQDKGGWCDPAMLLPCIFLYNPPNMPCLMMAGVY